MKNATFFNIYFTDYQSFNNSETLVKYYIILFFILTFSFYDNIRSQVSNYTFSETTGTYQAILPNVDVASWSGTISGSSSNRTSISLPFSFCFGGTTFAAGSNIVMSHDGWIAFGNPSVTSTNSPIPLSSFNNCISAFGADLITTGTSSYGARVLGTAPFRILVFQWGQRYFGDSGQDPFITTNYWRRDASGHSNDRLHFQIRLHESSGVIEFHYLISNPRTTTSGTLTSNVQVGLRGASSSDFNVRRKTTSGSVWNNNSSAGTALPSGTTNTMNFNNVRNSANDKPTFVIPASPGNGTTTAGPGTGTIFRWSPVGSPSDPVEIHSGCYNPLPIELGNFDVTPYQNSNLINWSTLSELNSDYFIIERSTNTIDWTVVNRIKSAGNSNNKINYDYIDFEFEPTINYYRLKQVDFDGTSEIFDIVSVNNSSYSEINIYPNPNNGSFMIEIYSDKVDPNAILEIVDITGKIILNQNVKLINGLNQTMIHDSFESGMYFVRVLSKNQFVDNSIKVTITN